MRLLYIFLDFTQNGQDPEGYRGHKQCGLNFGTEDIYTMECSSTERPYYCLRRTKREESDKVERGFWGDKRIYNISAIVGENGTGKTTLMHAVIESLVALYEKDPQELPFDFACLMQDMEEHLYLICLCPGMEIDTPDFECKKTAYTEGYTSFSALRKTKLLCFSNTLSVADMEQYNRIHRNGNSLYTDPLYDCSLFASMIGAQDASNVPSKGSLERQLYTYFTFKSYQEARYLFDRNQRNILLHMRKQGYPVPFPRELNLDILSSVNHLKEVDDAIRERHPIHNYSNWCQQYNTFSCQSQNRYFVLTELSLNCIANFLLEVNASSLEYSNLKKVVLPEEFKDPQSYIETMNSVLAPNIASHSNSRLQEYFQTCKTYIEFLWNNAEHIQKFWKLDNGRWQIILGEHLDPILQELMIRFVDLNRAVSTNDYFVIYQWGLSSGESTLLHIFTKLRYLLQGNIYDKEIADYITKESAQKAKPAQRNESIRNCIKADKEQNCDSVILFLDEADQSLHPEWQRMFVATLAEFLPLLYQKCRDIQIILSTHSPLMLGDFPAACVLYLKLKEDNAPLDKKGNAQSVTVESNSALQPFGQNLYTLLKDGFYLRNGAIGALAQKKIKRVLDDIQKIRCNLEKGKNLTERKLDSWKKALEDHRRKTVRYLPQGIIHSKLEEEIAITLAMIDQRQESKRKEQKKQELKEDIARLQHQLYELENGGEVSQ